MRVRRDGSSIDLLLETSRERALSEHSAGKQSTSCNGVSNEALDATNVSA